MPARLNRPVRDRIVQLHEQGLRFKDIAAELGVSPATVAKYCKDADAGSVMAASPAAQFTEHEVQWLKAVAANATQDGCAARRLQHRFERPVRLSCTLQRWCRSPR